MKLSEAIATADTMFTKPMLYSEFDKRDDEAEDSLYYLRKMKIDKKKNKSKKYLEKLAFSRSRMF